MSVIQWIFLFLLLPLVGISASITGEVRSAEDQGLVPGVYLTLLPGKATVISDPNGTYHFDGLDTGTYELSASMLGFQNYTSTLIITEADQVLEHRIVLQNHNFQLDEVVITGTLKEVSKSESAVPVEIYTEAFFKANPAPSIFESLQNVNGVRPQLNCNVCNTGDIHINGLEGAYTMVLIDGMPIVSGLSSVYGLTGIPQFLIERVEIVKGPASALYGSEAVGGIINVITKKPHLSPVLSVDVMGTSWQEISADVGAKYGIKKMEGLLGVNYFNYQNPLDLNGDNFTDLTLQHRISVFNKLSFKRADHKAFTLAGRYVYEDRWGGQMDWTPEFRGGSERYGESIYTRRWETIGFYEFPGKEKISVQLSANGHDQNSVYGNTLYLANQNIYFGQLLWDKNLGKHSLLTGLAYRYNYYDDNTPATFNSDKNQNQASSFHLPGVFMQDEISLSTQNKILLGLRYDWNSNHGTILTPRINYKWQSKSKKDVLRLSMGSGYRVVNVFTEDHAALTGARQVIIAEDLLPERSYNINLNWVKKMLWLDQIFIGIDASAFYTYFTNKIFPDYEANVNQIIYDNLDGYGYSQGISTNIDLTWKNWKALVGGTLMDVSNVEGGVAQKQLLTETFQGVWSISYEVKKWGLKVDYTGNVFSPMRLPLLGPLDDRSPESPWWSIQNIQVTKTWKKFEAYGGIKNLLNFTPAANSIARSFDPFDEQVSFDAVGNVIPTPNNPNALTFDPSYVYASNQGIRGFLGFRYFIP